MTTMFPQALKDATERIANRTPEEREAMQQELLKAIPEPLPIPEGKTVFDMFFQIRDDETEEQESYLFDSNILIHMVRESLLADYVRQTYSPLLYSAREQMELFCEHTFQHKGTKDQRIKEAQEKRRPHLPLTAFDPLILCPFVLSKLNSCPSPV